MKKLTVVLATFIVIDLAIVAAHFFIAKTFISVGMITPEKSIWIFRNELILAYLTIAFSLILNKHWNLQRSLKSFLSWLILQRLLFRILDILFIFNYGNHFTSLVLSDIDLESTLNFLTFFSYVQILLLIAAGIGLYKVINRLIDWLLVDCSNSRYFYPGLLAGLVIVLLTANGTKQTADYLEKFCTEAIIVNELNSYFFPDNNYYPLDKKISAKLHQFGLSTDSNYIKIKDKIFEQPQTQFSLTNKRPNVFMYIMESSTQNLVSYYNREIENLTPQIDSFMADDNTVVFPNAVNTGVPTLNSLFSLFFSFYSVISHEDVRESNFVFHDGFFSIASVLNENGYHCYYLTGISKTFTQVGRIIGNSGFSVYDIDDVKSALNEEPLAWGYSDHQMARFYEYFIKHVAVEPYFIAVTTIEGHKPYTTYSDSKIYDDGKREILNANHSTDDAFGQFYSALKESKQLEKMLMIVTADHPPHPTESYTGVLNDDRKTHISYNEFIPFAIRFPQQQSVKTLDTFFPSINFAPTLLHILDMNSSNLFEGYSILDEHKPLMQFFNTAYDINYYNNYFQTAAFSISQPEVNEYLEWRRASFLETYTNQKKKLFTQKKSVSILSAF
ncbi:MAG: sulfatase-like hydrolase/transferase [Calditrichaeota bacterium]|nr:sulfatase-like hydrolase/transferase [Calditrichota bacterium]